MLMGLIGGSGLYTIEGLEIVEERAISTPFGEPSSPFVIGTLGDRRVAFLPRHGPTHTIPPHRVNYRANLWGFKSLGVERIISVGAVGGISGEMGPGSIVLLDQIIDLTLGARPSTFYEAEKVVHVDFTDPYCPEMRDVLIRASENAGVLLTRKGTYVCVNGPRLETSREIEFFSLIGADVVGMTAMPEASLARELEICLTGIAVVTNHAAGISGRKLTTREVIETMGSSMEILKSLLREAVMQTPSHRTCPCKDALGDASV